MKKSSLKSIFSLVLAVVMLASLGPFALASEKPMSDNEKMVASFWESMNDGEWADWIAFYPEKVQTSYAAFASVENIQEGIGVLAISHSEVLDVVKVANAYAPKAYPELQQYFEDEATYECYKVDVNLAVKTENDYFKNGRRSYLTIAVKDGDVWRIGALCMCPAELADPYGINLTATGVAYGLLSYIPEPATISVMDEKGVIHASETFDNFIFNTTCNEIGNMGFHINAIRAQVMAVKMCGWWAKAGGYRAALGCDIKNGDVAYKSFNGATSANQAIIRGAMTDTDGYYMVSSAETGGKLFFASFYAGGANDNGQGLGRLRQNGANYLATEQDYPWRRILHYYYDNSSYNNPNVGIVEVRWAQK